MGVTHSLPHKFIPVETKSLRQMEVGTANLRIASAGSQSQYLDVEAEVATLEEDAFFLLRL